MASSPVGVVDHALLMTGCLASRVLGKSLQWTCVQLGLVHSKHVSYKHPAFESGQVVVGSQKTSNSKESPKLDHSWL